MASKRLDQQIEHIAARAMVGAMDRVTAQRAGLVAFQEYFECSRVSMWAFYGEPGVGVMRCTAVYTASGEHLKGEVELRQDQYRAYFHELFANGVYVCDDTSLDPKLDGMRDSYLGPLRIGAMLDSVFAYNGRAQGLLCCEQVGAPRHWTITELADLKRCTSLITRHTNRWARIYGRTTLA